MSDKVTVKIYHKEIVEVWTNLGHAFLQGRQVKEQYRERVERILRNGAANQLKRQGVQDVVISTKTKLYVTELHEYMPKVVAKFYFVRDVELEHKDAVQRFVEESNELIYTCCAE